MLKEEFRLEAKFYSIKSFDSEDFFTGNDILEYSSYNSIYGLNAEGKGYPVLRMNEFNGLFTGEPAQNSEKFSEEDFKLHVLKKGDILICRTNGNPKLIGKSAMVAKDYPFVYESHLFKIRPKIELITSATLVSFLNTKYGKIEIEKLSMQGNQSNFSLAKFKELRIPKFSVDLNTKIDKVVYFSFELLEESKSLYTQAETLLLKTLGLDNFTPSTQSVNIKSFKDSFGATGRLDAEYYQPKYEQIIVHIKNQGCSILSQLVDIKKSLEPGSDAYSDDNIGFPFLRVSDYSKQGLIKPQKYLHDAFVNENKEKLDSLKPKKDTILFSKDGSVGEAYCLQEDANFITSGAILHLSVKDTKALLPEYLTLVLNSKLIKMQSERDAGGSIILHWRVSEIENVIVPLVDIKIQTKITALVQQSFSLKKESEQLLEKAKQAVELAIEQGEEAAVAFLGEVA